MSDDDFEGDVPDEFHSPVEVRRPVVAIVGRPNVGKSTLFNRLVGERRALVHNEPGVTRDRNYGKAEAYGKPFDLIDTGGFDPDSEDLLLVAMREQAKLAVASADIILHVVDGRAGLMPADSLVHAELRGSEQPVFVVANKLDTERLATMGLEFHALGVDRIYPISAEHGVGLGDLMEALSDAMPDAPPVEEEGARRIRIAIVGRPNAGKSTLVNRLLGEPRLVTSDIPGTTRDSIDTQLDRTFELEDGTEVTQRYTLVDTAGIRRRGQIHWAVEKFGVIKAVQTIERSHVVVLVVDALDSLTDQDAKIANIALDAGRALIIALNKWDAVEKDGRTADQVSKSIREKRASLAFAPIVTLSALTGQRTSRLLDIIDMVEANWQRRIPTAELNRWFEQTLRERPPPLYRNRAVKLYYATQVQGRPPTFVFQSNMPSDAFPVSYSRMLENRLRDTFAFEGTPIRFIIRQRKSQYAGE
jgi:GTP-binding protein